MAHCLHLSVSDPDLNLEEHLSIPRQLRLTLRGSWQIGSPSENFRVVEYTAEGTVIEITCQDGRSYDITLTRPE